jgi:hypothetical protein
MPAPPDTARRGGAGWIVRVPGRAMEAVLDRLFPSLRGARGGTGAVGAAWIGAALGIAVTVLVAVQAFGGGGGGGGADTLGYGGESAVATFVFAFHVATLVFTAGEAHPANSGLRPLYAMLTIGSGTAATLAQAAVFAAAPENTARQAWAGAILALQSYADAAMVAIIVADLRWGTGAGVGVGTGAGTRDRLL